LRALLERADRFSICEKTMNIKKKLTNPFALVAQGFGLGAVLFFATAMFSADSPPRPQPAELASLQQNQDA